MGVAGGVCVCVGCVCVCTPVCVGCVCVCVCGGGYGCLSVGLGGGRWTNLLSPSYRAGIPEDSKVEGPAFTDAIRMYRQSKELYGTWEMLCGNEVQVSWGEMPEFPRA